MEEINVEKKIIDLAGTIRAQHGQCNLDIKPPHNKRLNKNLTCILEGKATDAAYKEVFEDLRRGNPQAERYAAQLEGLLRQAEVKQQDAEATPAVSKSEHTAESQPEPFSLSKIPKDPGTYILEFEVPEPVDINVGRLGRLHLDSGTYYYIGSAMGGLKLRSGQHIFGGNYIPKGCMHHIRKYVKIIRVWYKVGESEEQECNWVQVLGAQNGSTHPIPKFGSSNCKTCPSHLLVNKEFSHDLQELLGPGAKCFDVNETEPGQLLKPIAEAPAVEANVRTIKIADILMDNDSHPREDINQGVVTEYSEAMQNGVEFPPVIVFYDGKKHYLADGRHRIEASRKLGLTTIKADIRHGTERDTILFAVGANTEHGLRRTNADKRKAVLILLRDKEWQKWSHNKIAQICNVSDGLVTAVWRDVQEELHLPKLEDSSKRTVERKGKTYKQDTDNIGKKNAVKECSPAAEVQPGANVAKSIPGDTDQPELSAAATPGELSTDQAGTTSPAQNSKPVTSDSNDQADPWPSFIRHLQKFADEQRQRYPRRATMLDIVAKELLKVDEVKKSEQAA